MAVAGVLAQDARGVESYLRANPLPFPLLVDPEREVIRRYGVYHFLGLDAFRIARPSAFLIDRGGTIRFIYVGSNQLDRPSPEVLLAEAAQIGAAGAPDDAG